MKRNIKLLIIIGITFLSVVSSCKKEDADEPEMASADRLTGSWNVVESNNEDTITERYSATVTRQNDSVIYVKSDLVNPPSFHVKEFEIKVIWSSKKLDGKPTTLRGTIKNENDFEIVYGVGIGSKVITVKQHYTRK